MHAASHTLDGPMVESPPITNMTPDQARIFEATMLAAEIRRLDPKRWTIPRIARAFGVSPPSIEKRLQAARRLAEQLRRQRRGA